MGSWRKWKRIIVLIWGNKILCKGKLRNSIMRLEKEKRWSVFTDMNDVKE